LARQLAGAVYRLGVVSAGSEGLDAVTSSARARRNASRYRTAANRLVATTWALKAFGITEVDVVAQHVASLWPSIILAASSTFALGGPPLLDGVNLIGGSLGRNMSSKTSSRSRPSVTAPSRVVVRPSLQDRHSLCRPLRTRGSVYVSNELPKDLVRALPLPMMRVSSGRRCTADPRTIGECAQEVRACRLLE